MSRAVVVVGTGTAEGSEWVRVKLPAAYRPDCLPDTLSKQTNMSGTESRQEESCVCEWRVHK